MEEGQAAVQITLRAAEMTADAIKNAIAAAFDLARGAIRNKGVSAGRESVSALKAQQNYLQSVAFDAGDLKAVKAELKRYGVEVSAVTNTRTNQVDLFFKASDAAKIEAAFRNIVQERGAPAPSGRMTHEMNAAGKESLKGKIKEARETAAARNAAKTVVRRPQKKEAVK